MTLLNFKLNLVIIKKKIVATYKSIGWWNVNFLTLYMYTLIYAAIIRTGNIPYAPIIWTVIRTTETRSKKMSFI